MEGARGRRLMTPGRALRSLLPGPMREAARRAYYAAMVFALRGEGVVCPCCGGRFRRFLPFGLVRRENALCPACGALERHRLLWLYLERRLAGPTAPLRVLHVAPEPWLAAKLAARPGLSCVSVDLESPLAMTRMDLTRLAFRDGAFDVILCLHVLEHVPDDRAAMAELRRALAPGGWAILQSPVDAARAETYEDASITSPVARERAFGQRDHVRIYGRDYNGRLRAAGFAVEDLDFAGGLPPGEARRYALRPDETLTVCTRADGA